MATQTYCLTCERTVYVGRDDSDSCPVCSSPLVESSAQPRGDAPVIEVVPPPAPI